MMLRRAAMVDLSSVDQPGSLGGLWGDQADEQVRENRSASVPQRPDCDLAAGGIVEPEVQP
jgi:hypothetical protein